MTMCSSMNCFHCSSSLQFGECVGEHVCELIGEFVGERVCGKICIPASGPPLFFVMFGDHPGSEKYTASLKTSSHLQGALKPSPPLSPIL